MTNDLYNVIGDPKNWPTIAQNIDGGEYLVEQHATLLAWARRKAAEYGAADDLSQLPQPGEGPCADCTHDQHPDNHHHERFTIGQHHFCRAHAAPRAHAARTCQPAAAHAGAHPQQRQLPDAHTWNTGGRARERSDGEEGRMTDRPYHNIAWRDLPDSYRR